MSGNYNNWDLGIKRKDGEAFTEGEYNRLNDYLDNSNGWFHDMEGHGSQNDGMKIYLCSMSTESRYAYKEMIDELKEMSETFPDYVFCMTQYCEDYFDTHEIIAYQGETETLEGRIVYEEPKEIVF